MANYSYIGWVTSKLQDLRHLADAIEWQIVEQNQRIPTNWSEVPEMQTALQSMDSIFDLESPENIQAWVNQVGYRATAQMETWTQALDIAARLLFLAQYDHSRGG